MSAARFSVIILIFVVTDLYILYIKRLIYTEYKVIFVNNQQNIEYLYRKVLYFRQIYVIIKQITYIIAGCCAGVFPVPKNGHMRRIGDFTMSDKYTVEKTKALGFVIPMFVAIIVAVCIIIEIVMALLIKNALLAVILGILCIIGSFFVSRMLVMRLTNAIDVISRRMTKLAENGDLSSPVEHLSGGSELTALALCFDDAMTSMKNCVSNMSDGLDNVSRGNLTYDLSGTWKGDFATLKSSYDKILIDLCNMFSDIGIASGQVNTGSIQVADGAQMLSQGATQQAESIDELSKQLAEVAEKVNANAYAARNTTEIVKQTTERIDLCSQEMADMLVAMDEINSSSNEISKIIKVIDDIAFQTNILALNASVEAAHAGAAGKGFAVVADEVRNLAAKSTEAANQTNMLIRGSIASVEKGSKIARDTASVLEGIVSGANEISKEIANISEATDNQSEAIRQINQGVDQISAVVQSNTSTAEESAAASEELSGQSNMLKDIIARFKYQRSDNDLFTNGRSIDLDSDDNYSSGGYDSYGSSSYDSGSYGSSSYDSGSYSSSSYDSGSYDSSNYDSGSYDSSSYDSGSYNSSNYDSGSYDSSSYDSGSSAGTSDKLTFSRDDDDNNGDDGGFTPIQFHHTDYEDTPPKQIILDDDDDDFVNVDSKY